MKRLIEWTGTGLRLVAAVFVVLAWMGSVSTPLHAQQFSHIDQIFFSKGYGGANPLPQVLTITSTGSAFGFNASASTSSGGDWLAVSPNGDCCMTPASVSVIVSASAALAVGSYSGQVVFTGSGTSLIVNVTLVVVPLGQPVFDNTPGQLSFSMKPGGQPPSQVMQIGNGGTGTLNWRLIGSTFNSANFLSVSAQTGTAPTRITLGVLPENLPNGGSKAGIYTGQILFLAAGSTVTVPISVLVGDAQNDEMSPHGLAKSSLGARSTPLTGTTSNLFPASTMNVISGGFNNWNTRYGAYTAAPDGTNTAPLIIEANSASGLVEHYEYYYWDLGTGQQTLSFHFKAGGDSWVFIRSHVDGVDQRAWFDLVNGVVGSKPAGWTAAITQAPLPIGWYRCSVTFSVTQSAIYSGFGLAKSDQQISYQADNVSGVYQWGQQWEHGTLTDYQANVGFRYVSMTPCRVTDTRNATGAFGGPAISTGTSRDFTIPNSACGVPSTAQAYSLNVAVVPSGRLGYLTLWPTGQTRPLASTLNSLDGRIKSNAAIVPAGTGGAVSVFASDATNVILDINGYFVLATDPSALAFYPVTPCRIADTRTATAPLGGPSLGGGTSRTFPILSSTCSLPATAQAYSLNFAAVPGGHPLGYLTAWPTGQTRPVVASLNAPTGTVAANAAIVKAGTNGAIDIFASDATNLVIDVNGYFAPMGTGGVSLYAVTPCRVLDTRQPAGSPAITSLDVAVSASACGIPAIAQAHVFSVTVVPSGSLGYLTLWPQGQSRPAVATLNALDGAITSNLAIVPTTNGWISAFLSNAAHLILDITGYFGQ